MLGPDDKEQSERAKGLNSTGTLQARMRLHLGGHTSTCSPFSTSLKGRQADPRAVSSRCGALNHENGQQQSGVYLS
jgi:hypothetical protein